MDLHRPRRLGEKPEDLSPASLKGLCFLSPAASRRDPIQNPLCLLQEAGQGFGGPLTIKDRSQVQDSRLFVAARGQDLSR